jgi:hypothetical protein
VNAGTLLGPTIYTAGNTIGGDPPGNPQFVATATPDDARAVVGEQKRAGYDFIKVYSFLSRETHAAAVAEAHRLEMVAVGHVPRSVGLDGVLSSKQDNIAHAEEIIRTGNETDAELAEIVRAIKAAGTTITPNIFTYSEYLRMVADLTSPSRHPEMRFASAAVYSANLPNRNAANRANPAAFASMLERRRAKFRLVTKLLADAGVPLFVGSDTEVFGFAGHSAQLEMFELAVSGLTPYQVLVAAARAPGEFLARSVRGSETFGTIAVGSRADLVLVAENPLDDIRRVSNVRGVMVRGRWLAREALDRARDSVARPHAAAQRAAFRFDSLANAGRGLDAVNVVRAIRRAQPGVVPIAENVLRGYGRSLLARDTAGSLGVRRLAAEMYPDSHSAHDELAAGLLAVRDTAAAIASLRRSLALSPHNAEPRDQLARIESTRQPPGPRIAGEYDLGSIDVPSPEGPRAAKLVLRISGVARPSATLAVNGGSAVPATSVLAGGDRAWVTSPTDFGPIDFRLRFHGDSVTGYWILNLNSTGTIAGHRR